MRVWKKAALMCRQERKFEEEGAEGTQKRKKRRTGNTTTGDRCLDVQRHGFGNKHAWGSTGTKVKKNGQKTVGHRTSTRAMMNDRIGGETYAVAGDRTGVETCAVAGKVTCAAVFLSSKQACGTSDSGRLRWAEQKKRKRKKKHLSKKKASSPGKARGADAKTRDEAHMRRGRRRRRRARGAHERERRGEDSGRMP